MKGLVLAAGKGSRLEHLSVNNNKCVTKINGKPIIFNSLENLANAGIESTIVVVGYRAEDVIAEVGNSIFGMDIEYVYQPCQTGVVDAIKLAENSIAGDDFFLCLGDEFMVNPRHRDMVLSFIENTEVSVLCGYCNVDDWKSIAKTYSIESNEFGEIVSLVEKPTHFPNSMMGTGDICFRNSIYDVIDQVEENRLRKQRELPDLIMSFIKSGVVGKKYCICDRYLNLNTLEDYREIGSLPS